MLSAHPQVKPSGRDCVLRDGQWWLPAQPVPNNYMLYRQDD